MPKQSRSQIPKDVQIAILFKARWLCYLCNRPLVFPPALRLLAELVGEGGIDPAPAYYNAQWRRDSAPLLDELGASIDHVQALAGGGLDEVSNLAAICSRCNARKSARTVETYLQEAKPWHPTGLHGEPRHWDGLSGVFFVLAARGTWALSQTENAWLVALRKYYAQTAVPSPGAPADDAE